jgi:hypothetical protein
MMVDPQPGQPRENEWQFSLRSLFVLVTAWALLLSIAMTVPGLGDLPLLIGFLAVITTVFFAFGCLLGWIAKRSSKNRGNGRR